MLEKNAKGLIDSRLLKTLWSTKTLYSSCTFFTVFLSFSETLDRCVVSKWCWWEIAQPLGIHNSFLIPVFTVFINHWHIIVWSSLGNIHKLQGAVRFMGNKGWHLAERHSWALESTSLFPVLQTPKEDQWLGSWAKIWCMLNLMYTYLKHDPVKNMMGCWTVDICLVK